VCVVGNISEDGGQYAGVEGSEQIGYGNKFALQLFFFFAIDYSFHMQQKHFICIEFELHSYSW